MFAWAAAEGGDSRAAGGRLRPLQRCPYARTGGQAALVLFAWPTNFADSLIYPLLKIRPKRSYFSRFGTLIHTTRSQRNSAFTDIGVLSEARRAC